ncbi:putative disease resistance protein RGA3 isoform X2 [Humulus lupulus]|uniref:putative disease resistance protein RGA3 isoform X2 n=1 Tax=Humulus lupulus TaxID=3486 RepID=UPI002B416445|nr:putative disease resistance protein RGA3 isoform X2 [Humulus lupulus]
MADAVISMVVRLLGSLPLEKIIKEVSLLNNVQQRVENLKRNLRSIQAVLHDAENKRWSSNSESVKVWLETLEDDAQEMGNVLDRWNTLILRSQIENEFDQRRNSVSFFKPSSCFCFPKVNKLISCREIALKIEELDGKITKTANQIGQLGLLENMTRVATRDVQVVGRLETTSLVDETEIHGREEDKKALLDMLMSERSYGIDQRLLEVISIVGMGGLGKTTLAQLAFNYERVKNHFPKMIWVSVSEPFDLRNIVLAITEILHKEYYHTQIQEKDDSSQIQYNKPPTFQTLEGAFTCISTLLGKGRFLLVLDDVWNEEYSKWEPLEVFLKKLDSVGSKVLITTRKESVARVMGATPSKIIHLKELNHSECQLIFERQAFKGRNNDEGIKELRDIAVQIVKKCKGLPLAAKTLGGLMLSKRSRQEWEEVLRSQLWELNVREVEQYLFGPLLLSYLDLSSLEKRCLLYCSIYPKDYLIYKKELIELWMSEGYIITEEEGTSIFQNLAMRSFFQDFSETEDEWDGNVVCTMHDILHDFVQYLTKRECEIIEVLNIDSVDQKRRLGDQRTRHLTIAMESGAQFPNLELSRDSKLFLHTFLILRLHTLPANVGDLIHLRYLELSNNPLEELPDTICNLCNLQTFKLMDCLFLLKLPEGMGKLINLRSLYYWAESHAFSGLPKGISRLASLQYLDWFQVPQNETEYLTLRDLTKMNDKLKINLLALSLDSLVNKEHATEDNKVDLTTWEHVNELMIWPGHPRNEFDFALEYFKPHPKLTVLTVRYYTSHTFSPRWMMSLHLLREIEFTCCLSLKILPAFLGKLPSLESLQFWSFKCGKVGLEDEDHEQVPFSSTLYPKLKRLTFMSGKNWEEWEAEVPCSSKLMPSLQTLTFEDCPRLRVLPGFLQRVPMQIINIHRSSILEEYCRTREGNEWPKISHAKNIIIDHVHVQSDGCYVGVTI